MVISTNQCKMQNCAALVEFKEMHFLFKSWVFYFLKTNVELFLKLEHFNWFILSRSSIYEYSLHLPYNNTISCEEELDLSQSPE